MDTASQSRNIDELFVILGVWGKYQLIQFILSKLLAWPASNQLFSIWYLGNQPQLRCRHTYNSTDNGSFTHTNSSYDDRFYQTCKELLEDTNGTRCVSGYEYDQASSASSTTTEWALVCDQSYQAQLAQTLLIAGQALGATLFTALADKYGRRPVCLVSQWGMMIAGIVTAFSPNVTFYLVMRFIIGALQQGHVTMMMVLPMEILPRGERAMVHLIGMAVAWTGGMLWLTALGYLFRDLGWRNLQLAMTLTSSLVPLAVNMLFLDESIRWLFANGKVTEAMKLIAKACQLNKADKNDVMEHAQICIKTGAVVGNSDRDSLRPGAISNESVANYTVFDILRTPRLRLVSFVMFFGWINTALTHFGLTLTTHTLAGNRFLNYFLLVISAVPPYIVSYYTMTRIGRRATTIGFTGTTGICMLATILLHTFAGSSMSTLVTVLTILGTNTMTAVFGTLFQYTPELFPTNLRSIGVGMASTASRIGGMVGPFANLLIEYYPWAPSIIYGCFSLLMCLLYTFLPETVDKELPQTIEEINNWNKDKVKIKKSESFTELSNVTNEPTQRTKVFRLNDRDHRERVE